jgi:hypothetical protein
MRGALPQSPYFLCGNGDEVVVSADQKRAYACVSPFFVVDTLNCT